MSTVLRRKDTHVGIVRERKSLINSITSILLQEQDTMTSELTEEGEREASKLNSIVTSVKFLGLVINQSFPLIHFQILKSISKGEQLITKACQARGKRTL